MWITEVDVDAGGRADALPVPHLRTLVPRQGPSQVSGQRLEVFGHRRRGVLGLVFAAGQMNERAGARRTFDECADRAQIPFADNAICLPRSMIRTGVHVFGAVGDIGNVGDPVLALADLPTGSAQPTSSPQRSGEGVFESAADGW